MNRTRLFHAGVFLAIAAVCFAARGQLVQVEFDGDTAHVVNLSDGLATASQEGAEVSITIAGTSVRIVASGTTGAGKLTVSGDYATTLILNGLHMTGNGGACINLKGSNDYTLTLPIETDNSLSDGAANTEKGILLAVGSIRFNGLGSLTVSGNTTKVHGINSTKGSVIMDGGDITVVQAVNDGIHAKQDFVIHNGTLSLIHAGGDGVDCDGHIEINGGSILVETDALDVKGLKCGGTLTMNNGLVNMVIAGDQTKGIKCTAINIHGGVQFYTLTGGVVMEDVTVLTTNSYSGQITTNACKDPSYCTALKCDEDLTITGGQVFITHSGTAGKGISIDGDITITGGTLDIFTSGDASEKYTNEELELDVAAADGLKADGDLTITGGAITAISTGSAGDAISCDGIMTLGVSGGPTDQPVIVAETRGQKVYVTGSGENADYANPKAIKAEGDLIMYGGTLRLTTQNDGGEGMESKANMTIHDGYLDITAYDDCLNASSNITINGGLIYCYSMGNDAIDSNGTMDINGGTIIASGTTSPEGGIDCDQSRFTITGGTIVATGGDSSTPTANTCTQYALLYTGSASSNTVLHISSSAGDVLVYRFPRAYTSTSGGGGGGGGGMGGGMGNNNRSMVMLFSIPGLVQGTQYTIKTGGTITGGTEWKGYYTGATVSGGSSVGTFTPGSSKVISVSSR